jgi:hypothetical protein
MRYWAVKLTAAAAAARTHRATLALGSHGPERSGLSPDCPGRMLVALSVPRADAKVF